MIDIPSAVSILRIMAENVDERWGETVSAESVKLWLQSAADAIEQEVHD